MGFAFKAPWSHVSPQPLLGVRTPPSRLATRRSFHIQISRVLMPSRACQAKEQILRSLRMLCFRKQALNPVKILQDCVRTRMCSLQASPVVPYRIALPNRIFMLMWQVETSTAPYQELLSKYCFISFVPPRSMLRIEDCRVIGDCTAKACGD